MYHTDAQMDLSYRKTLKNIDENLVSRDHNALKFLCRDFIAGGKLERAKRPRDIFQELEYKGFLGPGDKLLFLAELLQRIHRVDLIKKLGLGNARVVDQKIKTEGRPGPLFSKFRLLLLKICDELTQDDFKNLMFSCQSFISKSSREEICDTPSLLSFLEQTDRISEEDVTFLEEMMDMLDNHELVRLVKLYKGSASSLPTTSHGQEININIGQAAQHQFLPSGGNPYNLPGPHITPSTSKEPLLSPAHFMNSSSLCTFGNKPLEQPGSATKQYIGGTAAEPDARVSSAAGARQPGQGGSPNFAVNTETERQPHSQPQENVEQGEEAMVQQTARVMDEEALQRQNQVRRELEMPSYPMTTSPCGLCVIINNEHFYCDRQQENSKNLEDRTGTRRDRDNLVHIFEKLDFEVEVHDDLTARDMYTCLGNIGERDHMPYSCFVCCILSHGTAGKVYGVDGIPIEISHLTSCVKGIPCRSLIGKPKLFFIQACQGQRAQRGDIVMDHDGDQDEIPMSIPNEADFLLGYATVPGFVSYRSKTQGSWYITKLVECLDRYHNEYELLDIMRKVNEEVAKAIAATKDGERKQVPAPQFTLRKRLFLKPVEIF